MNAVFYPQDLLRCAVTRHFSAQSSLYRPIYSSATLLRAGLLRDGSGGLDSSTEMPNDHGVLSLFALLCLFAALAVPLLKVSWVRWLYTAPQGFAIISFITQYFQIKTLDALQAREWRTSSAVRQAGRWIVKLQGCSRLAWALIWSSSARSTSQVAPSDFGASACLVPQKFA